MAYTSCAGKLAASVQKNCSSPIVAGYTGRGILIDLSDTVTWTVDSSNPRIISNVALGTGEKFAVIDNVWTDSFTGTNTTSSADAGRAEYTKTFTFRIPQRGAAVSKDFVEPLLDAPLGYAVVLEKMDQVGDGSYEIIGYKRGLKANADGITRNEYENGGDIVMTMSTVEPWFEVTLFDTDYATTKGKFETMLANTY